MEGIPRRRNAWRDFIMRTFMIAVVTVVGLSIGTTTADGADTFDRIIVKLEAESSSADRTPYTDAIQDLSNRRLIKEETALFIESAAKQSRNRSAIAEFPHKLYRVIVLEDAEDLETTLQQLNSTPGVIYAEPDYPIELFEIPNDPYLTRQWGLRNTGQAYLGIDRIDGPNNDVLVLKQGASGSDIHVEAEWNSNDPTVRPLIVIIDTGLDTGHPDIADNLWTNPGEIPGNGLDDDHNGFVDDVLGWDFSGDETAIGEIIVGDNDVSDSVGHGTHCSGIIGATSNNGLGVTGVCQDAQVVGLKIFPNALMSIASLAVIYAVEIGGDVINMSWGSPYSSRTLLEALRYARSNGVLPVAASGNFGDDRILFPASLDVVLTVGACNSNDEVTFFSSIGNSLDVVAPGRDVLSLRAAGTDMYAQNGEPEIRIIDYYYYLADGTSMAAPHVCGVAGVLLAHSPGLTPDELQDITTTSADDYIFPYGNTDTSFYGWDRYSGHGRVNLEAALSLLDGTMAKISSPYSGQMVTADVDIVGYAFSASGGDYIIELSETRDQNGWEQIASGTANVTGGYLGTLPVSGRTGDYTLRLTVDGTATSSRRLTLAPERLFTVNSPQSGETVLWFLTVRGSVLDPEFESYRVELKSIEPSSNWDEIYSSTRVVVDSLLCEASLGRFISGDYTLRVTLVTSSGEFGEDIPITIQDKLMGAFPQHGPLNGTLHYAPTLCDVDGDDTSEVIVSTSEGIAVFRADGTPFCCGWPNLYGVDCYGAPSAYDIDGDGLSEIAVCSEFGLNLFDAWGAKMDSFPKEIPSALLANSFSTPLLADIDTDGQHEILWISDDGEVYAYRPNGMSYFASLDGWFASTQAGYFFGSIVPFVFSTDLENDGEIEVIASFSSARHGGGLYVWQAKNGQPRGGHTEALIASLGKLRGGCIADFNNDGEYEIGVVGRTQVEDTVYAAILDGDGNYLPGWPVYLNDRLNFLVNYPAAGDVDDDGYPDLVFTISSAFNDGEIYVLRYDGTPYRPNLSEDGSWFATLSGALGCPVLGDVSGDGDVDVVVRAGSVFPGSAYERIFALDNDGQILSGWPIYTFAGLIATSTIHTPILADVDNDDMLDLICTSDDGQVYVWKLETPYDPELIPWGQYLHDSRRSGILPRDTLITAADFPAPEQLPGEFTLGQNYPNPFNSGTRIDFEIESTSDVTIEIFNVLGQKVRTLLDESLKFGKHFVNWDGMDDRNSEVASGVYFYRMKAGSHVELRKMVKLE